MNWRDRAICRDKDPDLFFPTGTSGAAVVQIADAKAVCRSCAVTDACLNWALQNSQDAGIWGGLTESERLALKRRRARARARSH